jgi:hypothetical protein
MNEKYNKPKDFKWEKSIFDNDFLILHTRCIAETYLAKEKHSKFNHCLN